MDGYCFNHYPTMSNTNTTPKKVAMIVANAAISEQTGWPIGFWWAELAHPYWEFKENGFEVELFSPEGGAVEADGFSDPEHESGYSADDYLSLGFKKSPKHFGLTQETHKLADLNPENFDAIFVTGGQSPMYTFVNNEPLQQTFAQFYEQGKIASAICHGTCILLNTRLSNGELLVKNKTWTGFANCEEDYADQAVGTKIQPFRIEDRANEIPDTTFKVGQPFEAYALRDGNLITGQQQHSGTAAARLVVEALNA